jgi:serine/threonine-protein kinase
LPDQLIVGARAGQVMSVQLTAPRKSVRFTVMTYKTTNLLTDNNTNSWTGTLPETGDYIILVEGNAKGSTYSITISIK